jgi:putative transposase
MTKTLDVVEPRDEEPLGLAPEVLDEEALLESGLSPDEVAMVAGLVRKARDQGLALTGPGGLLKSLTKTVLETALEEELSEHLGYDKHDPTGRNQGNSRNGYRSKTVVTDACGEVQIAVPRDREAASSRRSWPSGSAG